MDAKAKPFIERHYWAGLALTILFFLILPAVAVALIADNWWGIMAFLNELSRG